MKESSVDSGAAKRGFFGYEVELEPDVIAFQAAEYPERKPDSLLPYWRWLLVQSAQRLRRDPYVWLYLKKGKVVAHQGAIAIDAQIGGQRHPTGWFVETMAANAVRGGPIGPMLVKKSGEEIGLGLSLGQTALMRQLQFSLGWEEVTKLHKWIRFCGPKANLGDKLPSLLSRIAGLGMYCLAQLRTATNRTGKSSQLTAALVERFDARHDQLWERTAAALNCTAVRDSAYLNWKYLDRPNAQFRCFEFSLNEKLVGAVITMLRPGTDVRPYKRGYIVDVIMPQSDDPTSCAIISETVRLLQNQGAQTITCQILNEPVERALAKNSFMRRDSSHHFLVLAQSLSETTKATVLNSENWFLTLGDSDADAYPD